MRTAALILLLTASACGLDPRFQCDDRDVVFIIAGSECGDDCVVDFGTVTPGLTDTRRVTWELGACSTLHEASMIDDAAGAFFLEQGSGKQEQDAVFLEARPVDSEPQHGSIELHFKASGRRYLISLVVNE